MNLWSSRNMCVYTGKLINSCKFSRLTGDGCSSHNHWDHFTRHKLNGLVRFRISKFRLSFCVLGFWRNMLIYGPLNNTMLKGVPCSRKDKKNSMIDPCVRVPINFLSIVRINSTDVSVSVPTTGAALLVAGDLVWVVHIRLMLCMYLILIWHMDTQHGCEWW